MTVALTPLQLASALAGFTLAHAAWNVSDLPATDLLVPMLFSQQGGQRSVERFEASTQSVAIAAVRREAFARRKKGITYAFAFEGSIRVNQQPRDVLLVEFWAPGMEAPLELIQQFARGTATHPFAIVGASSVRESGVSVATEVADSVQAGVREGIGVHPQVRDLWNDWRRNDRRRLSNRDHR